MSSAAASRTSLAGVLLPLDVAAEEDFLFSAAVAKLHFSTAATMPPSRRRTSRRQRSTSTASSSLSIS